MPKTEGWKLLLQGECSVQPFDGRSAILSDTLCLAFCELYEQNQQDKTELQARLIDI
jgi:hypothetical protein